MQVCPLAGYLTIIDKVIYFFMVDDSVKFAWAYLLTYGKITNGKWCYYGGGWEDENGGMSWNVSHTQDMKSIADKAVLIGISWARTDIPTVSDESVFNDTESPSSDKLATLGTLVLLNGEKFLIGSSDDDAAHLAETAREIMKGKNSPVTILAAKL